MDSFLKCWVTACTHTDFGALGRARATLLKARAPFVESLRLSQCTSRLGKWFPAGQTPGLPVRAEDLNQPQRAFTLFAVSSHPFLSTERESHFRTSQEPARVPRPQEIRPHHRAFQSSAVCRPIRRPGLRLLDRRAPATKQALTALADAGISPPRRRVARPLTVTNG